MAAVMEVEVDSRQRLPLSKVIDANQHRFRVTRLESGEYLLTPLVSISERELAFLRNPEAVEAVRRGIEQAAVGKVTRYEPGHFAKLVAELGDDENEDEDSLRFQPKLSGR
jgi:hypothetical protein